MCEAPAGSGRGSDKTGKGGGHEAGGSQNGQEGINQAVRKGDCGVYSVEVTLTHLEEAPHELFSKSWANRDTT